MRPSQMKNWLVVPCRRLTMRKAPLFLLTIIAGSFYIFYYTLIDLAIDDDVTNAALQRNGYKLMSHYTWYYGKKFETDKFNFFNKCKEIKARKCAFTRNAVQADALLFHGFDVWPWIHFAPRKRKDQIWIYYTQESPTSTLWNAGRFNGMFNWTMTHQSNSDITIPYSGITSWIRRATPISLPNMTKGKKKLAYIVTSNCYDFSKRLAYVHQMQQHVPTGQIDVFGRCGQPCPHDCNLTKMSADYYFYLSFENSLCHDYITEKYYRNGLRTNAVPVVRGGSSALDYQTKSPPNSFIYADDFPDAAHLAVYLLTVANDPKLYNSFHQWKSTHEEVFMRTADPMCEACLALHNESMLRESRVQMQMDHFWNQTSSCRDAVFHTENDASQRLWNWFMYMLNIY